MVETRENMEPDEGGFDDNASQNVVDIEDQFADEITEQDVEDVEDVSMADNASSGHSKRLSTASGDSSQSSSHSRPVAFAKLCFLWLAIGMAAAFMLGIVIGNAHHRARKKQNGHPPATYGNPAFSGEDSAADEPLWDPDYMGPGMNIDTSNLGDIPNNSPPESSPERQYAKRKRHFTTLVVEWSGAAAVATPNSPARRALDWILDEDPFRLTTADRTIDVQQRYIMAVFYFATLGEHWTSNRRRLQHADDMNRDPDDANNANDGSSVNHIVKPTTDLDDRAYFLTYRDVCHWSTSDGKTGVFCDENGAIQKLEFRDFGLGGTLPRECGFLSSLTAINVEYNDIEGNIPTYFGLMINLQTIKFENNLITGTIPKELSNLKKLEKLDLDGNNFTGVLPSEIAGLERIVKIEVGGSSLGGSIPAELSNLSETLQKLDFRDNKFSGNIPSDLGKLTKLNYLDMENNDLTGTVPMELSLATSLEMLYLNGNDLTGSLDAPFCDSSIPFFEFFADCRGETPEVQCTCCTTCCNAQGSNCTTIIEPLEGETTTQDTGTPTAKPVAPPTAPEATIDTTTVVSTEASKLKEILATISDISLLDAKHTNQHKAFEWMAHVDPSPINVELTPHSIILQKYILTLIYISTNGKGWNDQMSYLTDANHCDWTGLTCNDDGEIVSVMLEHNNLDGTIVSEIGYLGPSLRKLHIGMNFLQGPLPSEIGLLTGLKTLDIFDNDGITGTIPSEFSFQNLRNLETIQLVGTGISGNLDPIFCTDNANENGDKAAHISANCFGPSVSCSCCEVCCDESGENCKVIGNSD